MLLCCKAELVITWPEDHVCLLVLKGGVDHNSHGNVGAAIVRLQGKRLWGPLALEMLSAIISLFFFSFQLTQHCMSDFLHFLSGTCMKEKY